MLSQLTETFSLSLHTVFWCKKKITNTLINQVARIRGTLCSQILFNNSSFLLKTGTCWHQTNYFIQHTCMHVYTKNWYYHTINEPMFCGVMGTTPIYFGFICDEHGLERFQGNTTYSKWESRSEHILYTDLQSDLNLPKTYTFTVRILSCILKESSNIYSMHFEAWS
jgi:hypothetical protein